MVDATYRYKRAYIQAFEELLSVKYHRRLESTTVSGLLGFYRFDEKAVQDFNMSERHPLPVKFLGNKNFLRRILRKRARELFFELGREAASGTLKFRYLVV